MYDWRKMTQEQRKETLRIRKARHYPWHSPPHIVGPTDYYHLSAACYEHKAVIGYSVERLASFSEQLLLLVKFLCVTVFSWCVLPNHYHLLIETDDLEATEKEIGKLHGRTSYQWNGEENCRGRKVWYNCSDRYIRGDRHFWATMNYIHHNPVRHKYAPNWQEWPFSSAMDFLEKEGKEKAAELWIKYPILDYGKGWDDPDI